MNELFPFYSIGHFINQPANPTEFEITRFEEMDEPEVDDPHKHTFYEIIWFDAGTSRQTIDYQEYDIAPGTLFFISPGQLHLFEEWQPLVGGCIFFTEDFLLLHATDKNKLFELSYLDNLYAKPLLQPDELTYQEIRHTIDLLIMEKNRSSYSVSLAPSLLLILLTQIQRCIDAKTEQPPPKKSIVIYKNLKKLIDAHFTQPLTASDYANRLHMTQHHLNLIVRQVTGKTTSELIRARSMLEAKRMLTFSDYTITEIAAELGYFDSSYFAKLFRTETGLSPGRFKQIVSEKYRRR
ncbi:AraC family transcriptional regulator [Spirosoma areae]